VLHFVEYYCGVLLTLRLISVQGLHLLTFHATNAFNAVKVGPFIGNAVSNLTSVT
jgi:hypothetical protein